jgi:hypothetical protein
MKAELLTGEIVTLEKGCNCITHNEPHWVHMDTAWRNSNRKMLDPAGKDAMQQYLGTMGIAVDEEARLDQKLRMFKSLGITRLIPEPSDELTDIQRQKVLNHFEDLRPSAPKQAPAEYLDTKTQVRIEAKERL